MPRYKVSRKCKFATSARNNAEMILSGSVLAIDPASGASSSPGYAISKEGVMIKSGVLDLGDPHKSIQHRLNRLGRELYTILDGKLPDVLAVERIRGSRSHEHLKWSVGVVVGTVPASLFLEVPVSTWRRYCPDNYVKSDQTDAEIILDTVLKVAIL
jgi:hypothetical protein